MAFASPNWCATNWGQLRKAGSVYTGLIHSVSKHSGAFNLYGKKDRCRLNVSKCINCLDHSSSNRRWAFKHLINSVKQIQPIDGILVPTIHVYIYIKYIVVRADTGALTELEPRILGIHPTNRCMSSCSGFTFSSGHVASTGSPSAGALQRISPWEQTWTTHAKYRHDLYIESWKILRNKNIDI